MLTVFRKEAVGIYLSFKNSSQLNIQSDAVSIDD